MKPQVLTWDWKASPGEVIEDVVNALEVYSNMDRLVEVHAHKHITGSDEFCMVLNTHTMTPQEVADAYERMNGGS